jgi:CspA family cold shock protein
MATGTVKWFNTTKGYGFIEPDDGTSDIFLHATAVAVSGIQNVVEGCKLSFDKEEGRNGKAHAVNLKALCATESAS